MNTEDFKTEMDPAPKAERLPEREERKLKLNNLSEKQKNLLYAAAAGVAGVSLGAVAMTLMGFTSKDDNNEPEPPQQPSTSSDEATHSAEITIHTDAPFADSVTDEMSFAEAFGTARDEVGAGGIFEWRGNLYNTYFKPEWDAMSAEDKAEFFSSIDPDYLPTGTNEEDEIIGILNDNDLNDTEDIVILEEDDLPGDTDDDAIVMVEDDLDDDVILEIEDDHDLHDTWNPDVDSDTSDFDFDDPDIITDDV